MRIVDCSLDGLSSDLLVGILRLDGIVASTEDFHDHASVLDGASIAINEFLGERGCHSRFLIPVHVLPFDSPIELALAFAYKPRPGPLAASHGRTDKPDQRHSMFRSGRRALRVIDRARRMARSCRAGFAHSS